MRAGSLHQVARFQARSTSQDSYGAQLTTWTTFATEPVALLPLEGRELLAAAAIRPEVTVEIQLRYRGDITAQHRALIDGKIYNIHGVIDVDSRRWMLKLQCSQGVNEG